MKHYKAKVNMRCNAGEMRTDDWCEKYPDLWEFIYDDEDIPPGIVSFRNSREYRQDGFQPPEYKEWARSWLRRGDPIQAIRTNGETWAEGEKVRFCQVFVGYFTIKSFEYKHGNWRFIGVNEKGEPVNVSNEYFTKLNWGNPTIESRVKAIEKWIQDFKGHLSYPV